MELTWAGGVRRKTEGDSGGMVESISVGTANTATGPEAPPGKRRSRRSEPQAGTFVEVNRLEKAAPSNESPKGRFRVRKDG